MTLPARLTLSIALACASLTGCAATRFGASREFVRQWQSVRVGMTAQEIRSRLGEPSTSYVPTDGREGRDLIEYWVFTRHFSGPAPSEGYVIHYHHGRASLIVSPFKVPQPPKRGPR